MLAHWDRDGRVALLPWSDPVAKEWMAILSPSSRDSSMHVRVPEGPLQSGSDALLTVLATLPGTSWLASAAERVSLLRKMLSWSYMLVSRSRGHLSRMVPDRPGVVRRPRLQ